MLRPAFFFSARLFGMKPLPWIAAVHSVPTVGKLVARSADTLADSFSDMLASFTASEDVQRTESSPQQLQAQLVASLEETLASAGIELSEPAAVTYSQDAATFHVEGAHPQKVQIEAVLNAVGDHARRAAEVLASRSHKESFSDASVEEFDLNRHSRDYAHIVSLEQDLRLTLADSQSGRVWFS